jgi:tetratricopeptide (TPR) repeat protein
VIRGAFEKNKNNPLLQRFLSNVHMKKVAWSMDSHHQWPHEVACQQFFDTYYLAHSNYIDKFEPGKARWLPCALQFDGRREDVLPYIVGDMPQNYDVVSVYRDYLQIGDRNAAAWMCWKELQAEGRSVFLGQTRQWNPDGNKTVGGINRYYEALRSGKVILNLSIIDDLNMRNLEALLLNQVMVANRVPDHEKMKLDYSNVVFFDKFNVRSFRKAMEEAMEKTEKPRKNTMATVLNHHTMIHRFVTMINEQLGTKLSVPDIDVSAISAKQKRPIENKAFLPSAELGDIVYDEMELGIKAVYANIARQQPEEAVHISLGLLEKYPVDAEWQGRLDELFFIFRHCSNRIIADKEISIELLLQALADAIRHAVLNGVSLQQLGQLSNSIPVLLRESPAKQRLCKVLASMLSIAAQRFMQQKEWTQAVYCLEKAEALGVAPEQEEYLRFAEAYRKAGQPEKAVEKYTQALKLQ